VREIVAGHGPITAYEIVPLLQGEPITALNASWWLPETLCHLRHLELGGELERDGGEPERWNASSSKVAAAVL
jgi:hypothetical protein